MYSIYPRSKRATSVVVSRYFAQYNNLRYTTNLKNAQYVFVDTESYNTAYQQLQDKVFYNRLPLVTRNLQCKEIYYMKSTSIPETYLHVAPQQLQGFWVQKDMNMDKGLGIQMLKDPVGWYKKGYALQRRIVPNQEMMDRCGGRAFDVRVMVMVLGNGEYKVYRDGLLRYASTVYDDTSTADLVINSNIAFQEHVTGKRNTHRSLLSMFPAYPKCMKQIEDIVEKDITAIQSTGVFKKDSKSFELFGYDFMIDNDEKVWVIEVNQNPGCPMWAKLDTQFYIDSFKILLPQN